MNKGKLLRAGSVAAALTMALGCLPVSAAENRTEAQNENLKIGIMSDTHYFSNALYSDCEDFTTAMNSDRKMFRESEAILDSALEDLVADKPDVVLISGDLTKDGEQVNHEAMAEKLSEAKEKLKARGVDTKFYVINGNHDINNPNGKDYSSGQAVDADRTTVEEFKEIYQEFGYGEDTVQYAPDSDRGGSLSYVAKPADGFTLIVVDSGKYSSDQTDSGADLQETGGVISEKLLNWVTEQAQTAKAEGDVVMVMQHHGVVAHFADEPAVMADYLVDNYEEVSEAYASAGVSYVFTGHMHANDIAAYTASNGNIMYDIETGSQVTYPSPSRRVTITKGSGRDGTSSTMDVETKYVDAIDYIDPDTGEQITDLTAYGKKHTLSADVIKTMINQQVLGPQMDRLLASGGSKALAAQLLGTSTENVNAALVNMVRTMLPTDKETGLRLSMSGFTFSVYYDAASGHINISQVTGDASGLKDAVPDGTLVIPGQDGEDLTITLPETFMQEFSSQMQAQPAERAARASETIELFIDTDTLDTVLLEPLYQQADETLLENKESVFRLVDTLTDSLLNNPVDETHTIFDLINVVYQSHLAGEDSSCEAWVETAIEAIRKDDLLKQAIDRAVDDVALELAETLGDISIDTDSLIQKGNTAFMTNLAHSLIKSMIKDAGDVVAMVDFKTLLPESLLTKVETLAYSTAYTMSHDTNYAQDNDTRITIDRMLSEVIRDAQQLLEQAKKVSGEAYTEASYQKLQAAITDLESAVKKEDKEQILEKTAALEEAVKGLKEKEPDSQNNENSGSGDQNQGQDADSDSADHGNGGQSSGTGTGNDSEHTGGSQNVQTSDPADIAWYGGLLALALAGAGIAGYLKKREQASTDAGNHAS